MDIKSVGNSSDKALYKLMFNVERKWPYIDQDRCRG